MAGVRTGNGYQYSREGSPSPKGPKFKLLDRKITLVSIRASLKAYNTSQGENTRSCTQTTVVYKYKYIYFWQT